MKKNRSPKKLYKVPFYIEKVLNVESWLNNSRELIKTADTFENDLNILWGPITNYKKIDDTRPKLHTSQVIYFMLIAYAIENMCKAVIVHKKRSKIKDEIKKKGKLPSFLKTHNLVNLVTDGTGLTINDQEEELLYRLERHSVWAAKYPVPTAFEDIDTHKILPGGKEIFVSYLHCEDNKRIKSLVIKIDDNVKSILKNN